MPLSVNYWKAIVKIDLKIYDQQIRFPLNDRALLVSFGCLVYFTLEIFIRETSQWQWIGIWSNFFMPLKLVWFFSSSCDLGFELGMIGFQTIIKRYNQSACFVQFKNI
jgi:hypothetical protein